MNKETVMRFCMWFSITEYWLPSSVKLWTCLAKAHHVEVSVAEGAMIPAAPLPIQTLVSLLVFQNLGHIILHDTCLQLYWSISLY